MHPHDQPDTLLRARRCRHSPAHSGPPIHGIKQHPKYVNPPTASPQTKKQVSTAHAGAHTRVRGAGAGQRTGANRWAQLAARQGLQFTAGPEQAHAAAAQAGAGDLHKQEPFAQ